MGGPSSTICERVGLGRPGSGSHDGGRRADLPRGGCLRALSTICVRVGMVRPGSGSHDGRRRADLPRGICLWALSTICVRVGMGPPGLGSHDGRRRADLPRGAFHGPTRYSGILGRAPRPGAQSIFLQVSFL